MFVNVDNIAQNQNPVNNKIHLGHATRGRCQAQVEPSGGLTAENAETAGGQSLDEAFVRAWAVREGRLPARWASAREGGLRARQPDM